MMLRSVRRALALGALLLGTREASATFHFIDINEIYTNADGTVQFIELIARSDFQTELSQTRIVAIGATGAPVVIVLNLATNFPNLDNTETVLIATAGFEAVAGFAPDYVIPSGSLIPFPAGRVNFQNDSGTMIVDFVAYGTYTGSLPPNNTPASDLPCNGRQSLKRTTTNNNPSLGFSLGVPTPRRNDGTNTELRLLPGIDCNNNDSPDLCDIARGDSLDTNGDHIPDECDVEHSPADFDVDGDVDLDDYAAIHDCIDGPNGGIIPDCDNMDFNGDETVDLIDLVSFINEFTGSP